MERQDVIVGIAGAGGDGVISVGEALTATAASLGYHAMLTKSFGSQIRGGESSCRIRISPGRVLSSGGALDVAVALNWDDFLKFGAELPVEGRTAVIYDAATGVDPSCLPLGGIAPAVVVAAPLAELARSAAGSERAKNAVVLGLLAEWLGLPSDPLFERIARKLRKKGDPVVEGARKAFAAGRAYAAEKPLPGIRRVPPVPEGAPGKLLLDGNEMCAAAAIFAGCRFFSGYPITPSSEIMQMLDRELWKHGGTVLQAEDEIAGIGAALGASYAGCKAMTATSGPGMSLKTEMLGLATIAEIPLVCVNVQRGGPSTGIPTKSEQSDLFQAVFSAHGDVLRPVIAPTGVADTFLTTVEAFNLAEAYQTPVVLLSDQEIAQRKETVDPFPTEDVEVMERRVPTPNELQAYARFHDTESGVSPMSHPGLPGGSYLASGIEHTESGSPSARGGVHARMNEKRFRKLRPLAFRGDLVERHGDPTAPLALIAWGSLAGVVREALALAEEEGLRVKALVPRLLFPIPEEAYRELLTGVKAGLVVEQSHQGQLHRLLRMYVDLPAGIEPLSRSAAMPISPSEVLARLKRLALKIQRRLVPDGQQPQ